MNPYVPNIPCSLNGRPFLAEDELSNASKRIVDMCDVGSARIPSHSQLNPVPNPGPHIIYLRHISARLVDVLFLMTLNDFQCGELRSVTTPRTTHVVDS